MKTLQTAPRNIGNFVRSLQFLALFAAFGIFCSPALAQEEPINLNQADAESLQNLPSIGLVKAAAIIKVRKRLGGFTSYEQLLEVSGIGEKTLIKIRRYSILGDDKSKLSKAKPATAKTTDSTSAVNTEAKAEAETEAETEAEDMTVGAQVSG